MALPEWTGADLIYSRAYAWMSRHGADEALIEALNRGDEEYLKSWALERNGADIMDRVKAKSHGHIGFTDGVEFFERAGEVYRAPRTAPLQVNGYRIGRWECSRSHFDHYRDIMPV